VRTVFLGTSDFAATVLERLAASRHRPALVVTRPDRPKGRGRRLSPPPVAETARALGLEVHQPQSVNDDEARARIAAAEPDAVVVCAFGALIKDPLLSEHLMLNVHPSLLPRWRGAAPVERAIMAGDEETGVSIMRVTEGLDSGPVARMQAEPIHPDDTYGTLAPRLAALGGDLAVDTLDDWPVDLVEQDDSKATYAEKVDAADRTLDPSRPPEELERQVRALHPHIGARIKPAGGEPLRVHEAVVAAAEDGAPEANLSGGAAPQAGELAERGGRLLWGCAGGALELRVVQPPGGRPMDAAAYLRGHRP
jgi:methionyl-tRNA formyltransferase